LDPVTHMLTGACLSRAGLNRKTALATLTLALATESPDIDSITYFGGPVAGLQHHRGITHSFLGAPFVAAIVVAGVYGIYRLMEARRKARAAGSADALTPVAHSATIQSVIVQTRQSPNWKLLYAYALLGTMVHLFQDFTNNYGLRPFAPFNPKWYSWDIVYIVDPVMLLAMILALTLPGLMALVTEEIGSRKAQFRGRGAAICALVCVVLVIFVRDFEHRRAVNALSARTYQNEEPLRASAFPQMFNPLAWNGVVETRDFFHMVPVDMGSGEVDPLNLGIVRFKPEETPVTLAAKKSRLGRVYLDWAAYPLVTVEELEGGRHKVEFEDLRFESVEGVAQHRRPALTGTVILDPQLHVEEMYTERLPKNAPNP
jgi:inner membrane protein